MGKSFTIPRGGEGEMVKDYTFPLILTLPISKSAYLQSKVKVDCTGLLQMGWSLIAVPWQKQSQLNLLWHGLSNTYMRILDSRLQINQTKYCSMKVPLSDH